MYNRTVGLGHGYDADCLLACNADDRCVHYTYFPAAKACEFAGSECAYQADPLAEATYKTPGRNVLASALVSLQQGVATSLRIGQHSVQVGGVGGVDGA